MQPILAVVGRAVKTAYLKTTSLALLVSLGNEAYKNFFDGHLGVAVKAEMKVRLVFDSADAKTVRVHF